MVCSCTCLFFRTRGELWETQDPLGDRVAEAAAKSVRRPTTTKTTPTKTSSGMNILRRSSKPKNNEFLVSQSRGRVGPTYVIRTL